MGSPSRPILRKYLNAVLANTSDFDAFCLDYFPSIHSRFSANMDRVSRVNLLLELEDASAILDNLQKHAKERCAKFATILQENSPRLQKQQELRDKLESLYQSKESLGRAGQETGPVEQQILATRRELRQGPQLIEGEILCDRYRLHQVVGQGGFANVWQAWDRQKTKFVALKVLHPQYSDDQSYVERFNRGARCMTELSHANIVRVYSESIEYEGFHFYVMEYLSGGNLASAVREKRIPKDKALQAVLQTGDALAYAHESGLIHRDVKPHNILLDGQGNAHLSDFDLVLDLDSTGGTRTGGGMGTFIYAAPEALADAKSATGQTDIYSLGMTAIFVVFGADLTTQIVQDRDKFISTLSCDRKLKQVLTRATKWDKAQRYATVSEMCAALKFTLGGKDPADSMPELLSGGSGGVRPRPVVGSDAAQSGSRGSRGSLIPIFGVVGVLGTIGAAFFGIRSCATTQSVRLADLAVPPDHASSTLVDAGSGKDLGSQRTAIPLPPTPVDPAPRPVGAPPVGQSAKKDFLYGKIKMPPYMVPSDALAKIEEGRLKIGAGRPDMGWALCLSAAGNPQFRGLAVFCMGEAEFARSRTGEVINLGKLALKDKGPSKDTYLLLGKAYYRLNDCNNAKSYWQRVLNVDSTNPEALAGMSKCP